MRVFKATLTLILGAIMLALGVPSLAALAGAAVLFGVMDVTE